MKVALFFGSFNPIHVGHLMLANYIVEFSEVQEIWFVVSPQNPFKDADSLLAETERLKMVNLAIEKTTKYKSSDVEFHMPKPSFSIDTLKYLSLENPNIEFVIVLGADNLLNFDKWKNFQQIIDNYNFLICGRPDFDIKSSPFFSPQKMTILEAPLLKISSTFIREMIKSGKDIRFFLHDKVYEYIVKNNFYK